MKKLIINKRPSIQAGLTFLFWVIWAMAVYFSSRWMFLHFPKSGDFLGVFGTLILFIPTLQTLAWDLLNQYAPMNGINNPYRMAPSDPFTFKKLFFNVAGIGLVGVGFAVNYWSKTGL